jgi:uncharacterized membrane-anchored protein YitT (DUF2179 family)
VKKFDIRVFFKDYIYVTIGSLILAITMNTVLLPNHLVAGGASGISVVLNHAFGWDAALTLYAINIPLLLLCFLLLGKTTGIKTIYGSLIFPFFVGLSAGLPTVTHNVTLAAVFGGVFAGIGIGLEFRGSASTGGTAIIAQVVNKYFHVPLGASVWVVDGLVILSAFIAFDIDVVLFSLICLFVIGRVIDLVQAGPVRSRNVFIISKEYLVMKDLLTKSLDKGVTMMPIESGYHGKEGMMLMTVVHEKDFSQVKEALQEIDEEAFIISMPANEVLGRGFDLKRVMESID